MDTFQHLFKRTMLIVLLAIVYLVSCAAPMSQIRQPGNETIDLQARLDHPITEAGRCPAGIL